MGVAGQGKVALEIAVGIDHFGPGVTQNNRMILVERFNATLQEFGSIDVIMRRPLEVLALAKLKDIIPISRCANVLGGSVVANARVLGRIGPADTLGPIRRGIVGNQQLEVRTGLLEK